MNFLREDKDATLQEIFDFCVETDSKAKFFTNVLDHRDVIIENYKLMQLYNPALSLQGRDKVHYALENFEYDSTFGNGVFTSLFSISHNEYVISRDHVSYTNLRDH